MSNHELLVVMFSRIWKFPLPIPDSFLNRPEIREKLQLVVDGRGDIPLLVSASMSGGSMHFG